MTTHETKSALSPARAVWVATVLVAVGLIALLRVPTILGVKVEEANRDVGFRQRLLDKRGSEYLWRVWWRARDDFVDVGPSWLVGAALLVGLAVFVGAILAAYRIALSIPSSPPPRDV